VGQLIDTSLYVKYTDTSSMLSKYLRKSDTASLSNRINLKVNISDTAVMLSPYLRKIDTTNKFITNVFRKVASDSVFYVKGGSNTFAFKDSIGTGSGGGGTALSFYLNGGTNQGTILGNTYYQMSTTAVVGTGVDFIRTNLQGNGLIAEFLTDVNQPNKTQIDAGNWNLEFFFSASSPGGSPTFYTELYKYNGSTFTLIASNSGTPEGITGGTSIDAYFTTLAIPLTTLLATDRLAIRVYVVTSGRTLTLHTQNSHLCQIITNFSSGITILNGLTNNIQTFATGTSGSDFNISSSINITNQ
jgi:hypothetical protein